LTLKVEPTKPAFRSGELIQLKVTLQTNDRAVCLSKGCYFRVLLAEENDAKRDPDHHWIALCGGAPLAILVAFPYLIPLAWLDIADVAGRYDVVRPDSHRHYMIEVRPVANWQTGHSGKDPYNPAGGERWSPGRVVITVVLRNDRETSGVLPLPIAWSLYSHRIEGKTSVILESP
jgi:hypothetical protein